LDAEPPGPRLILLSDDITDSSSSVNKCLPSRPGMWSNASRYGHWHADSYSQKEI